MYISVVYAMGNYLQMPTLIIDRKEKATTVCQQECLNVASSVG
jgi:hypothetical protein